MSTHIVPDKSEPSTLMTQASDFVPARIVEIELGQPLPSVSAFDEKTDQHYRRALCLVRLHTQPLGVIELPLNRGEVVASDCAQHIWRSLQDQINEHLRQDGLPVVTELGTAGLPALGELRCLEARKQLMAHAPFVSIIICTRDRPERVEPCLRSLLALDYPHYEVIVVENAPRTSAIADFIQQNYQDVPQVRYVREERPGLSWARNCGILAARGEILAFTDDDVVVDRYWLVELVKAFNVADNVACVTGLVLPLELETPAQLLFEEEGGFNKGFTRRIFDLREHRPKTPLYPYHTGHIGTGASMAFTAAFLHSVGGFDPVLGSDLAVRCGQDTAAFFQVITRGYKLVYEPASLLYHLHRRDYAGLRKQIYNYGVGLTAYLMKCVFDNPRLLLDFISKVPYGFFLLVSPRSPKNSKKLTHYPKELTQAEWRGMLYGPIAYLRGRWALHRARKTGVYTR